MYNTELDSLCRTLYLDLMKQVLTASIYDESAWSVVKSINADAAQGGGPIQFVRYRLKNSFIRLLKYRSLLLVRQRPFEKASREVGRDRPLIGFTMIGRKRLENIQACFEDVNRNRVPGDLMETGVWRGGATIFMRALLKAYGVEDRKVWVADSFEGLPAPKNSGDGWDRSGDEVFQVSIEQVRANFAKFDLLDTQVQFLKGWFADTLPTAPVEKLAILRLDGDLYSSTMDALENLYRRVSQGGFVIIDDYFSWPACRHAVTDFLSANGVHPDIKAIDQDGVYWKV